MAHLSSRIPVRLHGSSGATCPVCKLCNETWNTTNNPNNDSCYSSESQHQELCIPGTLHPKKQIKFIVNFKSVLPHPLYPSKTKPLFVLYQVVTHYPLGYCGRPRCTLNIYRLLLLSSVALGDRTGGQPTDALCALRVSGAQQNGCSCQLADPAAKGSQGPPGQQADFHQTQALPQEQQVALPETDPNPHLQSPALWQSRKKTRKKTRWVAQNTLKPIFKPFVLLQMLSTSVEFK